MIFSKLQNQYSGNILIVKQTEKYSNINRSLRDAKKRRKPVEILDKSSLKAIESILLSFEGNLYPSILFALFSGVHIGDPAAFDSKISIAFFGQSNLKKTVKSLYIIKKLRSIYITLVQVRVVRQQ